MDSIIVFKKYFQENVCAYNPNYTSRQLEGIEIDLPTMIIQETAWKDNLARYELTMLLRSTYYIVAEKRRAHKLWR